MKLRSRVGNVAKRVLDCSIAGSVLVLLSPLIAAEAAAIRLRLGSPVIFRQRRPGLHGVPFEILKFRTMSSELGPDGLLLPDAQRITRLGRLLRRTSLDELPELVNVLRGDMSLVGPRPLLEAYLVRYTPEQARRHDVRPGVTGLAQVNGRNAMSWDDRLRLDTYYVDSHTMRLDLRIIVKTIRMVVTGHGVESDFGVPMPHFEGTS